VKINASSTAHMTREAIEAHKKTRLNGNFHAGRGGGA
jgi:hypothetical protein